MNAPQPETVARWGATVAALAALVLLAVAAGVAWSPTGSALVVLAVALPFALWLWRRRFEDASVARERAEHLGRPEPYAGPPAPATDGYSPSDARGLPPL